MHTHDLPESAWHIRNWYLPTPPQGSSLWVCKVVHYQSAGQFDSLQMPSGITLRLLVAGQGRVRMDGREHVASAGDFFCALPGEVIHFHDTPQQPWQWWEWQLSGPGALDYVASLGVNRKQPVLRARSPEEAGAALSRLLAYFDQPDRQPYHALALVYEIAHHCRQEGEQPLQPQSREGLVRHAQALLESRFENGLNINELARELGVDRTTLLRAFREYLHQTPLEYLQNRRLAVAKDLLRLSDQPIRAIARHTGFRTDKYFIRVFRQKTGITPALWRQQQHAVSTPPKSR